MLTVSAPGKLLLFGEYAVLHGATALVAAVVPRARCTISMANTLEVDGGPHGRLSAGQLPFAAAVVTPADQVGHYALDTAAFVDGRGLKLGLGSSAASTVALVGALELAGGRRLDPGVIYARAQGAHRGVQGTGSGADIAASAFGGLLRYTWSRFGPLRTKDGGGTVDRVPGPKQLLTCYTGQPASTPDLVAAVAELARRDPATHSARMETLGTLADAAINSGLTGPRLVELVRAGASTLYSLGQAAGVDLVIDRHHALDRIAAQFGGAAKPTGAGGGDLAWIVGPTDRATQEIAAALSAAGFEPRWLTVAAQGVRVD